MSVREEAGPPHGWFQSEQQRREGQKSVCHRALGTPAPCRRKQASLQQRRCLRASESMAPFLFQGHRKDQCRPFLPEAKLVERWLDVPDRFHLIPDPAAFQSLLIQCWVNPLCSTLPRLDCVPHSLSRHHTTLHGCVRTLDLWHVHEARAAADEAATREGAH